MNKDCSTPNCLKDSYCKNLCQYHYFKKYRQQPDAHRKHLQFGKSKRGWEINKKAVKKYIRTEHGKKVREIYQKSFKNRLYQRIWRKNLASTEATKAKIAFLQFGGSCQCCGSTTSSRVGWHIDHKDGKFRGILCHGCNVALGFVSDSVIRLKQLILYLEKHE